jgi:NAD(P)H-hydrate epimerase
MEKDFLLSLGLNLQGVPSKTCVKIQTKEEIKALLPKRKRNSHKGTYGKTAIVAGSEKYTGAAYLSAKSALRSGAGYTALFVPKGLLNAYMLKVPEVLLEPLNGDSMVEFNEENFSKLLDYDSIAYGMGMGVSEAVYQGAIYLLKKYSGKLILDADGLNSIAKFGSLEDFKNKKCDVLITPHAKELSRLTGRTLEEILSNPYLAIREVSSACKINVLLKGAATLLISNETDERVIVNVTGNSAQAKGGTGDVLSGVIAGLCAQGISAFNGGKVGSFLVGLAAEFASKDLSEYSATPSDFIEYLGKAFLAVAENSNDQGED